MYQTKVSNTAGVQSVEIPNEYHLTEEDIFINRLGDSLVITPKSSKLASMISGLDMFTDDFMEYGDGNLCC